MAGLYSVITECHPTLLLDEFELGKDSKSRDFMGLLRAGSRMGETVLRATGAYDVFGPKIMASREGPGDAALESRGLYVVARPFSRNVSGLTRSALESIAERLQPKLASFRLSNYARLKSASASFTMSAGLSARVQDMARALALPITGEAELESQLLTILESHDQEARVSRVGEPEWFVTIALLGLAPILGPGAPVLWTAKRIGEVAQIWAGFRGETFSPTPRKVGVILRSLGLNTRQLGSLGRGLESSSTLKDRIHAIAKGLGICAGDLLTPELPDPLGTCTLCERYGLNFDNTGKRLRYSPLPEELLNPTDDPPLYLCPGAPVNPTTSEGF